MPKYKQQKVKIKVPDDYTTVERKAIGQDIIDFIVERTQKGYDKDGKRFKGYSKSYKESLDFKIAGKSSIVDLTLTEEMLNELKIIRTRKGEIEIGFDGRRNKLNGKVEGNRLGTYGNKKKVVKGRDFLGIKDTPLKEILKEYPLLNEQERLARVLQVAEATRAGEILSDAELTNLMEKIEDDE